jgi:hypothetical protein
VTYFKKIQDLTTNYIIIIIILNFNINFNLIKIKNFSLLIINY